jgi:hypothetical protein
MKADEVKRLKELERPERPVEEAVGRGGARKAMLKELAEGNL